ncbi:transcriptional regulator Spx [Mycoplasmatota bacterium]|nr:transcriptional regulator Spx [Mycoplasmatota bacterium]
MIQMYTTPSCGSCRKAKKWFNDRGIPFTEKNIFSVKMTQNEVMNILRNTENGVFDIISSRSKLIVNSDIDLNSLSMNELINFIIDNPSVLRRPIILSDTNIQIGYNEDDIRVFIPVEYRRKMMCLDCSNNDECDYKAGLLKKG